MTDADLRGDALQPGAFEIGLIWLYRIVAAFCLLLGIGYWVRLIGYHEGADWRFDLMPYYWQAAAASLAVLFPIAAIGLWMTASWGPVLWFVCAAAETLMYLVLTDLFGANYTLVGFHVLTALLFASLRTGIYLQKRQAE